jgi:hypothetical protein
MAQKAADALRSAVLEPYYAGHSVHIANTRIVFKCWVVGVIRSWYVCDLNEHKFCIISNAELSG